MAKETIDNRSGKGRCSRNNPRKDLRPCPLKKSGFTRRKVD
jgi:hypothetical protein